MNFHRQFLFPSDSTYSLFSSITNAKCFFISLMEYEWKIYFQEIRIESELSISVTINTIHKRWTNQMQGPYFIESRKELSLSTNVIAHIDARFTSFVCMLKSSHISQREPCYCISGYFSTMIFSFPTYKQINSCSFSTSQTFFRS